MLFQNWWESSRMDGEDQLFQLTNCLSPKENGTSPCPDMKLYRIFVRWGLRMTVPAHIWSANSSDLSGPTPGSEQGSVRSQRGLESHVRLRKTVVQSPISRTGIFVKVSSTLRMASWFNMIADDSSVEPVDVDVDEDEADEEVVSSKWEL